MNAFFEMRLVTVMKVSYGLVKNEGYSLLYMSD